MRSLLGHGQGWWYEVWPHTQVAFTSSLYLSSPTQPTKLPGTQLFSLSELDMDKNSYIFIYNYNVIKEPNKYLSSKAELDEVLKSPQD